MRCGDFAFCMYLVRAKIKYFLNRTADVLFRLYNLLFSEYHRRAGESNAFCKDGRSCRNCHIPALSQRMSAVCRFVSSVSRVRVSFEEYIASVIFSSFLRIYDRSKISSGRRERQARQEIFSRKDDCLYRKARRARGRLSRFAV